MAHPSRSEWAEALASELDGSIVWDQVGSAWDTGKRALLAGTGSHVLVVQDDAILSEGLRGSVERMIEHSGPHPISLYAQIHSRMQALQRLNPSVWYLAVGPLFGVACVIPTADVDGIVAFGDKFFRGPSYDQRLWHYYQKIQVLCLYTYPSLVDHRVGHGSLMGRDRDRPAYNFGSGKDTDWSTPPLLADNRRLYPVINMQRGSRVKQVRYGTGAYRQALRSGFTEQ